MEDIIIETEQINYNKIYARVDEQSIVIRIFSEAFEQPTEQDICINEVNTDRHGANNYQVYDDNGIPNYAIVNGRLVKRDKTSDVRLIQINSYPSLVDSKIRQRYSMSDELAILRQRDIKPDEFAEYNFYCEQCKLNARQQLNLGDNL